MSRSPEGGRAGRTEDLVLVKLGGSLITEKGRDRTPRRSVIRRLAAELARALPGSPARPLLGHGSGSFGHPAAAAHGLADGLRGPDRLAGITATQTRAAELHAIVAGTLREAGVPAFTAAPSGFATAADGRLTSFPVAPLELALGLGLVPVLYGDVVLDRERGVTVCSTERVLERAAAELTGRGWTVRRAVWLGDTPGVYGPDGSVIPRIGAEDGEPDGLGGADGTDVTGGMAHRVEVALRLARRGIPSWIGDGRRPGALDRALAGSEIGGTRVVPAG